MGCVGPGTAGKRGREGEKKKSGVIHEFPPFFFFLFFFFHVEKEKKREKKMERSFTLTTRGAILQMNPAPTA